MQRPTEFTTRKGNRVYRRSRKSGDGIAHAEDYTFRAKQDGRTAYFNLGSDKRQAAALADEISAFLSVSGNTLSEALETFSLKHRARSTRKVKSPHIPTTATVGEICRRYTEASAHLSPFTIRNNVNAIRHIAASILGLPKLKRSHTDEERSQWRSKVDTLSLSALTLVEVENFRQREFSNCQDDPRRLGSAVTTTNTYVRCAKSLFCQRVLPHYEGIELPNPLPFSQTKKIAEPPHRYTSKIEITQIVAQARLELRESAPSQWITFLLALGAGLRRAEIDRLLWQQVDFDRSTITIESTQYFRPKAKNSHAEIDIHMDVLVELGWYRDICAPSTLFVLPGTTQVRPKSLRAGPIFKKLANWLRSQGVDSATPLHTLRKEAGSLIFQLNGSIDQAALFLRNDPRVAREHYVAKKSRLELNIPGIAASPPAD